MIQIRAKSSWLHTQNFLNHRPGKPNRPVSHFWKEINSLMSRLLGRVPQTTVMVLAVVQANLVRPSLSRYEPVTGNSVKWGGQMVIIRRPGERGETWGLCFQHPLDAICYNRGKLHRTNLFQRGYKGSRFLPQAMTSTSLSIWIRVPGFNPMRMATSFPVCSSAEHNGWDSELHLPHNSKSPVLTDPFTEVPGHCVFTLKSEKIFIAVGRLLRYGEGTKSSEFGAKL